MTDLVSRIIQYPLKADQYFAEDCSALKKIIVGHHTAGSSNPFGVIDGWNTTPEKVGTPFVIGGKYVPGGNHVWKDGDIIQCFSSKYYDYHLGLKTANNVSIAKATIGIEVCNWGSVASYKGKFYSYTGHEIPADEVVYYTTPFKAHASSPFFSQIGVAGKPAYTYHRYTDAQIASFKELCQYLCNKYPNIDKTYKAGMWDISQDALAGMAGLWTHVSYRKDKVDQHPQPNLVATYKSISVKNI